MSLKYSSGLSIERDINRKNNVETTDFCSETKSKTTCFKCTTDDY